MAAMARYLGKSGLKISHKSDHRSFLGSSSPGVQASDIIRLIEPPRCPRTAALARLNRPGCRLSPQLGITHFNFVSH